MEVMLSLFFFSLKKRHEHCGKAWGILKGFFLPQ